MIGFGSPADTTRESVIVLMVSPLLALRLVIDHNTKQGAEFPRFLHHDRAARSIKRLPIHAANRCKQRILEPRRNELSGIPSSCKSRCLAAFSGIAGVPAVARAYACRVTSLAKVAFFVFLVPQFGFWPLRPLRAERPHSFRIFPKPGLWRGPQRCGCVSLTSRLH